MRGGGGGVSPRRQAFMVLAATGTVLLGAVLLVAGVVLQHTARRSALLARSVSDGPVYPIGAGPARGRAAPIHRYARKMGSALRAVPPPPQQLHKQQLVNWDDPREVFDYFADGDDWITLDEARSAFAELGMQLTEEEVTDMFNKFDTDGDGKVSWPEFEAGFGMLQEEPEEEPEEPTDDVAERMRQYASLHPVYNRCAKQADLTAFNAEITKTCGNVNELSTCSYSCTSAMRKWSSKMGCCFETVLDAYKHADPSVEHQWRMWQGTMSGKCGVTFEADNCGEAVGEHGFRELENQVDDLKKTAAQNQDNIQDIANQAYYNQHYYENYYDPWGDAYGYGPSEPNAYDYDDYYDSTDFYGDNYYYPEDTMVPPTHYHDDNRQSMAHAGHGPANGKRGLGDEVMDMPAWPAEDMGDVHVPSEKISPYSYAHGKHMEDPRPSHRAGQVPPAYKSATQSLAAATPRMQQLSANAYDDSINYMNSLRIKEGMRGKVAPTDPMLPRFGESWQGSARGSMSEQVAGIAPPTPGESWQGKARYPLQSLEQTRGVLPAELPFQARSEEQKELADATQTDDRLSEEEDVAFPMARGVLIGGDGSVGIGRPGAAAVDRIASPTEGPLYVDANVDGHNTLTEPAAIREARYENNWDNAQNEEQKHPFDALLHAAAMDPAKQPRKDAGTKTLEAAGVNV